MSDPSAGKNLNADDDGKTLLFFDFGNPKGPNNLRVYEKNILVKREDNVITTIPKKVEDKPQNVWAQSIWKNSPAFMLIIGFENGKIEAFKINTDKKDYELMWEISVQEFKLAEGGKEKDAEIVDVMEEEKMLEEG